MENKTLTYKKHLSEEVFESFPLNVLFHELHPDSQFDHEHDFSELILVLDGSGDHHFDSQIVPLEKGQVFYIPPGIRHFYKNSQQLSLFNILYDPKKLSLPLQDLVESEGYYGFFIAEPQLKSLHGLGAGIKLIGEVFLTAVDLCTKLSQELKFKADGYRCQSLAYLMQLICLISRNSTGIQRGDRQRYGHVIRGIQYMDQHYAEPIDLDRLSIYLNLSKSTLLRYFQLETAQTPMHFLRLKRMNAATEALRNTNLSVTRIALDCGFCDGNALSASFKTHHGFSPREFRNKQKQTKRQLEI